jgi:hypothetical protein
MAETCRQVFNVIGLNANRMALEWASAAEGPRFVELITKYVARIRGLGPLGSLEGEAPKEVLERRLEAALKAAETPKVRTAYGNVAKKLHETGDFAVYTPERISQEVAERVLPTFRQELLSHDVLLCLAEAKDQGKKTCSSGELMDLTGASSEELNKLLSALAKKGVIEGEAAGWSLKEKGE